MEDERTVKFPQIKPHAKSVGSSNAYVTKNPIPSTVNGNALSTKIAIKPVYVFPISAAKPGATRTCFLIVYKRKQMRDVRMTLSETVSAIHGTPKPATKESRRKFPGSADSTTVRILKTVAASQSRKGTAIIQRRHSQIM